MTRAQGLGHRPTFVMAVATVDDRMYLLEQALQGGDTLLFPSEAASEALAGACVIAAARHLWLHDQKPRPSPAAGVRAPRILVLSDRSSGYRILEHLRTGLARHYGTLRRGSPYPFDDKQVLEALGIATTSREAVGLGLYERAHPPVAGSHGSSSVPQDRISMARRGLVASTPARPASGTSDPESVRLFEIRGYTVKEMAALLDAHEPDAVVLDLAQAPDRMRQALLNLTILAEQRHRAGHLVCSPMPSLVVGVPSDSLEDVRNALYAYDRLARHALLTYPLGLIDGHREALDAIAGAGVASAARGAPYSGAEPQHGSPVEFTFCLMDTPGAYGELLAQLAGVAVSGSAHPPSPSLIPNLGHVRGFHAQPNVFLVEANASLMRLKLPSPPQASSQALQSALIACADADLPEAQRLLPRTEFRTIATARSEGLTPAPFARYESDRGCPGARLCPITSAKLWVQSSVFKMHQRPLGLIAGEGQDTIQRRYLVPSSTTMQAAQGASAQPASPIRESLADILIVLGVDRGPGVLAAAFNALLFRSCVQGSFNGDAPSLDIRFLTTTDCESSRHAYNQVHGFMQAPRPAEDHFARFEGMLHSQTARPVDRVLVRPAQGRVGAWVSYLRSLVAFLRKAHTERDADSRTLPRPYHLTLILLPSRQEGAQGSRSQRDVILHVGPTSWRTAAEAVEDLATGPCRLTSDEDGLNRMTGSLLHAVAAAIRQGARLCPITVLDVP